MNKIFYIPNNIDYVIMSDLFQENYIGGAELTLEAILEKCPGKYFKINSQFLTEDLVKKNKDKIWIIGNFSQCNQEILKEFVRSGVKFYIIECDYKYCQFRSKHLHKIKTGKDCDCHVQKIGLFIRAFFSKAQKVFFMSFGQMSEYINLFPQFNSDNFLIQGSTFSDESLGLIKELADKRKDIKIINKTVILKGGSWIKNETGTIDYCQKNNIEYELIGGIPYNEFLNRISQYKSLTFHPASFDTSPRITIEAKLLRLELDINDNVQHKYDQWFNQSQEDLFKTLQDRTTNFWKNINGLST